MTPDEQRAYDLAAEYAMSTPFIYPFTPVVGAFPKGRQFMERGVGLAAADASRIAGELAAEALTMGGAAIGGAAGGFGTGLGHGIGRGLGEDPLPTSIGLVATLVAGVAAIGGLAWLLSPRVQAFRYRGTYAI